MSNKQDSERGSVGRKVAIGIAVLVVIIAIVAGIVANSKKSGSNSKDGTSQTTGDKDARSTADKFINGVYRSDTNTTWDMMDAGYRKDAGSKVIWSNLISSSISKGAPKFVKQQTYQGDNSNYKDKSLNYVNYTMTFQDVNYRVIVFVVKDGGTWKIDGMDTQKA